MQPSLFRMQGKYLHKEGAEHQGPGKRRSWSMWASGTPSEGGPVTPREGRKPRWACGPALRLCPDIPLCTRSLGPPEVRPDGASGSGLGGYDFFDMDVEHAPAVGVHQADGEQDLDPKWDSVDDAMPTLEEAQRAFSEQREFRHHPATGGLGTTLQVVPRAVAATPTPRPPAAPPAAPHTWPTEKPALGLMLDSEDVIRLMQQKQEGGGASARGWMSPPQQPEAMPPSIRQIMNLEPLQSDAVQTDDLVGDLFGAQAQAAIMGNPFSSGGGPLLNGHAYAPSPSTPAAHSTGSAACAPEFSDRTAFDYIDPHLPNGSALNGKVQAVVANGGKFGQMRHDDDIDMSTV